MVNFATKNLAGSGRGRWPKNRENRENRHSAAAQCDTNIAQLVGWNWGAQLRP